MTRVLLSTLLGGVMAALVLGQSVRADAPKASKEKPRTFVVLVGVSKYADKQIKPRPNAEKDVQALYELFTNKDHPQTEAKNVKLLTGAGEKDKKATRENFLAALKWLAENAKENDTAVLAFVGQGGPLGDSGDGRCYFLANSTFKGRAKDAVAPEEIEDVLRRYKGKNLCVFLDVNFKGFVDDGGSRAISEPTLGKAPYREFLGDDGSDDHMPVPGRIAFLATNGLNPSLDLEKNGIFTTVLLEALRGGADNDGKEEDGLITVDEVTRFVNKRLPELARTHGKTEKEKEQDHYVLYGNGARFVLATNPKAIGAATKRLARFEELVKGGDHYLSKHADQARNLLTRMPPLEAHRKLRNLYKKAVESELSEKDFNKERLAILASMKLTAKEASAFAEKVVDVIDIIQEEYFRTVRPGEMVVNAVRGLYQSLEEPIPPGVEQELGSLKVVKRAERLKEVLSKARLGLGRREDLDNTRDLTITLTRMLNKLDPHTTYIDPDSKKKFDEDIGGKFSGIGVQIRKDAASDQLLVVTPIKGSPAFKAGMQAGDLISEIHLKVDNKGKPVPLDKRVTPTKGLPLSKAVKLIQGQPNTDVTLTIVRDGKPQKMTITRGEVEVESVLGVRRKANADWNYLIDNENKIGYIRLVSFQRNSIRDMKAVMDDLVRKHGLKGFVLDLRFNPGGLLDVAVQISDLFINDGTIVRVQGRGTTEKRPIKGREAGTLPYFPMAVLLNGYSASGSEIVAAALQDHGHARIFGERSYGKGSVQNIRDLEVIDPKTGETRKAEIKLTTAMFFGPLGRNMNKATASGKEKDVWGVRPDEGCRVALTPTERRDLAEHLRNLETIERPDRFGKTTKDFKDRQLDAAVDYVRGMIKGRAKHGDRFQPRKAG